MDSGGPVGGRRTLVEDALLGALARAQGLYEHVPLAPALQDVELEHGELLARVDRAAGDQQWRWMVAHGAAHCRCAPFARRCRWSTSPACRSCPGNRRGGAGGRLSLFGGDRMP